MAKLIVEVLDASDLMPKDGQGSASPFVEVDFDEQRQRTQTKNKDLNPLVFNIKSPRDLENQTISVYVYDDQKQGHHKKFLGRVKISGAFIPFSDSEALVQRYPLDKRGIFSHIKGDIALRIYAVLAGGGGGVADVIPTPVLVETEKQNVNNGEDRATPFTPFQETSTNNFEEQYMKETEIKKKKEPEVRTFHSIPVPVPASGQGLILHRQVDQWLAM